MNIAQEKIDDLNALVKITLAPEDYTPRVEKALKEQAKKANLPGFRKGMVPVAHIKRMYGKSILVEEINNMLNDNISKHLTDNKVEILGQPLPVLEDEKEYNWDYSDTFEFGYELGLAPAVDVEVSSKDKFTHYNVKADEETLAERIKNIRKSYGKMTNPEASAEGDVIYAELTQLAADGTEFEGGIVSTGSIRTDLVTDKKILKTLVGVKKEDSFDLEVNKAFNGDAATIAKLLNISEEDAAELKSKFKVVVKNVNRLEEADLNQEFFDKIFGAGVVTDEAGFKAKITEEVESMFKQDADRKLQNDIYEQLTSQTKMQLPDEFLRKWLKATNEKLSDEELAQGYDDFAKNLKWTLIENKIIKDNDIKIDYKDVFETAKQRLDAQFKMYSPQALPEDQLAQYTANFLQEKENANRIFEEVKALKVFDYIKSVGTLNEKEIEYNKFKALK
ncbi:trigger factor [Pedobacter sp. ASV28]|uniref:trigger factor n=1 Tax=Pedobacter sp. ASV28 TaxID=2795123 RepID=UPI0018ECFCC0|nr:trigger factor [Pedobacter sp. ASV28]